MHPKEKLRTHANIKARTRRAKLVHQQARPGYRSVPDRLNGGSSSLGQVSGLFAFFGMVE